LPPNGSSYSDLDALFLMRLARLQKLRSETEAQLPAQDARCKLVRAALRSTIKDCVELGLAGEARALLEAD
jgi:hypothetical protein